MMYETKPEAEKSVLVSVDTGEFDTDQSLSELENLAETAGVEVIAVFTQKREHYDGATCIGAGRLKEISDYCADNSINLLIFDHELTSTQIRNIEKVTDVKVVDRTTLILDIFAQRARTKEGQLQVELAQLQYRLPRLAGIGTSLSRLGGGIGTRGPGETKLESDRRHIRRRIASLEKELEQLERRREIIRQRRKKDRVTTVAIVGYTNAGKSTLFNALTEAGVLAEDKLFATLDPTSRALKLPDGRQVLMVDTVGLISRLPHNLIEAFKSTLEEAANADLILHLCDISNDDARDQMKVVTELLDELGCGDIPVLTVLNKCDKIPEDLYSMYNGVLISAKTGYGFDNLLNSITTTLDSTSKRVNLLLPYDAGSILAEIRRKGRIYAEHFTEEGTLVDAIVDYDLYSKLQKYIVEKDI